MTSFYDWFSGRTDKEIDDAERVARKRNREALEAKRRVKEEVQAKEQAEQEKEEAKQIANQLLSEKEEREKLEAEQRSFKWGPQKMPKWTDEEAERLIQSVLKSHKDSTGNPIGLKLLVFGPTGHGKSSFCNGCRSALKGDDHPSTYYPVANVGVTLTRGFHAAPYGDHWIIDMAGIFESKRINSVNIEDIASGKVPFYAEITDTLEVKDQQTLDLPAPGKNDVSCVVIVLKYNTALGPELRRQIEVILALGGKGVISYHLVLTRLDECDPQFNDTDNLPNLYHSPRVQAAVKKMSEETGIPPNAISFIKNYTGETETDINSSLLHLRVLERVIQSGLDQVEKGLDQKRQRALYSDPKKITVSDLNFITIVLLIAVAVIYVKIFFFV